jgi:tetratricopeptide (TPR) repeat protein
MNNNPPTVTWRVLLPLVIIGVILQFAFPSINSWVIALGIIFAILVIYRKVFIGGVVGALSRGRNNPYLFSEEFEKAVEFASEQLTKNPKDVVAHLTRSTAYIQLGNLEAARADCEAAIALDPKSVYALNNRAVIYLQQGDFSSALNDMQKAIELQPDNSVLLYTRGAVYARMGNDEAALKDFNEAIEIEPDQAATYIGRGNLSFKQGDLAAALADYQKGCDLSPGTHQFIAALAVAEFAMGEESKALERWRQLPTRYSHYNDADWQRRVLGWPEATVSEAGKLIQRLESTT